MRYVCQEVACGCVVRSRTGFFFLSPCGYRGAVLEKDLDPKPMLERVRDQTSVVWEDFVSQTLRQDDDDGDGGSGGGWRRGR